MGTVTFVFRSITTCRSIQWWKF